MKLKFLRASSDLVKNLKSIAALQGISMQKATDDAIKQYIKNKGVGKKQ